MSRVTMKDVARLSGVDASTVSLALRDDPRIRAETRERVRAAAKELGYAVNPLISAWVRSRRASMPEDRHISVVYVTGHPPGFDWRRDPHFRVIFGGLRSRLEEFGFRLSVFDFNDYDATPERLESVLHTRNVQGLVFGPENQSYQVEGLAWERYSMVTIGYALDAPRIHRVTEDHFLGMEMALERCRALGGKRIGLTFTKPYNHERQDRWAGAYVLHCQRKGEYLPIFSGNGAEDDAAARRWIDQVKPDMILTDAPRSWSGFGLPIVCYAISDGDWKGPGVYENNRGIGRSTADAIISLIFRNERGLPTARKNILVELSEQREALESHSDLEEFFPASAL